MDRDLVILGVGRLGEALLAGLLQSGVRPERIRCVVRRAERARQLADAYGVRAGTDPVAALSGADVVVVAVKPRDLRPLLRAVAPAVHGHTVVSVVAGVSCAAVEELLPADTPVVRAMPNVAAAVRESITAVAAGRHAGAAELDLAERLLRGVGRVERVAERELDAVTALSGSGPAYVFLLAEAMVDAGVLVGLPRETAVRLVVQTVAGAAGLLRDGHPPADLRAAVTSPGGTTAAALRVLERAGLRAAVLDAVDAAARRSHELSGP